MCVGVFVCRVGLWLCLLREWQVLRMYFQNEVELMGKGFWNMYAYVLPMLIRTILSALVHIHTCPPHNLKVQGFGWSQSRPPNFTYSIKPSLMNSVWLNDPSVCCFWWPLCSWWSVGHLLRESLMLYPWFLTHIPSGVDLLFRECNAPRPIHFLDTSGQYEEISLRTQSSLACKNQ